MLHSTCFKFTPSMSRHASAAREIAVEKKAVDPADFRNWVAVALEPGQKPLLFDSFGRKPSATFMPHLMHANITDPGRNQEWESGRLPGIRPRRRREMAVCQAKGREMAVCLAKGRGPGSCPPRERSRLTKRLLIQQDCNLAYELALERSYRRTTYLCPSVTRYCVRVAI